MHSRPGAAFFPPLLGIPPLFAPAVQNHDSASFHSRTTGKNSRSSTEKGNGKSCRGNNRIRLLHMQKDELYLLSFFPFLNNSIRIDSVS